MGKLIVIDGLDGSGKETQARLLQKALTERGIRTRMLSFPRYGEKSAAAVELYLSGALGAHARDTGAYAASVFFSVDRYISSVTDWRADRVRADTVVIANRYTTANAVHHLSKLPRAEWDAFLQWLWDFEFDRLGLPRPDLAVYLCLEPAISRGLIEARAEQTGRKMDIHETDDAYLAGCYEAARYASKKLGWTEIHCSSNGEIRTRQSIADDVWAAAEPLLQDCIKQEN